MSRHNVICLEHIDPRWTGSDYQLICGLCNDFNEVLADISYNTRKTNRFVPYRVKDYPAPTTFGDTGEFLINGLWVVCEFGGSEWWQESNKIGCGVTAKNCGKGFPKGSKRPDHSERMKGAGNPMYGVSLEITKETRDVMREKFLLNLEKDPDRQSRAGRAAGYAKFVDPDHPELGVHNAGNLVQVQKKYNLPHGPENRVKIKK